MAENWNNRKGDHAACIIAGDREGVRRRNWATVMAGAAICQVIGPWEVSAQGRPATPGMLEDMRALVRFFETVPLARLAPRDALAAGDAVWSLASENKSTIVLYAPGGSDELWARDVPAGKLTARWLDLAAGATGSSEVTHSGGELRLVRPHGFGGEAAVALERAHLTVR